MPLGGSLDSSPSAQETGLDTPFCETQGVIKTEIRIFIKEIFEHIAGPRKKMRCQFNDAFGIGSLIVFCEPSLAEETTSRPHWPLFPANGSLGSLA